jgi:sugar phosphate isomerase/epimerase
MTVARPKDMYQFLEHAHSLGAGGVQINLFGNEDLKKIRSRAEELGMFIEVMLPLPKTGGNTAAFEKTLQNAKALGATCARTASGGRRYEVFQTWAEYDAWVKNSTAALDSALPLFEKYKIRVGLENHKDRTVDQLVALLKKYSSPYLGSCLDLGNNISVLDDPMDTIEKLLPFVVTTHIKDMGVASYKDGFLLSEVPLGEGFLDIPRLVSMIHSANPKAHFLLEMITRDPLEVPCLTNKYWATFPDRGGLYLAKTLRLVQEKGREAKALPHISHLSQDEQIKAEEDNVKKCMAYASKVTWG